MIKAHSNGSKHHNCGDMELQLELSFSVYELNEPLFSLFFYLLKRQKQQNMMFRFYYKEIERTREFSSGFQASSHSYGEFSGIFLKTQQLISQCVCNFSLINNTHLNKFDF